MKIILLTAVALLSLNAQADLGPKPTLYFSWKAKGLINQDSVQLLQCKDSECGESAPLQKLGPQGFSCCDTGCTALAYGFTVVSQLEGKVDGRVVKSKPFKTEGMNNYLEISEVKGKIHVTPAKKDFSNYETTNIRTCQVQDPALYK